MGNLAGSYPNFGAGRVDRFIVLEVQSSFDLSRGKDSVVVIRDLAGVHDDVLGLLPDEAHATCKLLNESEKL